MYCSKCHDHKGIVRCARCQKLFCEFCYGEESELIDDTLIIPEVLPLYCDHLDTIVVY